MARQKKFKQFVICVSNENYPASLEVRKVYEVVPDPRASAHQMIRIIDESGEDYLYTEEHFMPIELPQAVSEVLLRAS